MESLFLWPDRPVPSLFVLWLLSLPVLWAARRPMLELLGALGRHLGDGFAALAGGCRSLASDLSERNRAALLAAGELELRHKLDRELQRIDQGFADKLGKYSVLQRRVDDLTGDLENDYKHCGDVPPEVPGWGAAVETISSLPQNGDPHVQKILDGIKRSMQESQKKALQSHRDDASKRHKILGGMLPQLRDIKALLAKTRDLVDRALETTTRVNGYVDQYGSIQESSKETALSLGHSSVKLFLVSLAVLAIALGGAFINFQLIALPMSELVPAAARIGGVPISTVSALILVLMEAAIGIFLMDMLGITELFPRLATIPASRRRVILSIALFGLFFLAAVESSLAVLREQIVEADAALKLALAGAEDAAVLDASRSKIPVIGQAVLGFILPWIMATVAIPLEMLLDSGRHVLASILSLLIAGLGHVARTLAHAAKALFQMLPNVYDIYIAIPLRIEALVRHDSRRDKRRDPPRSGLQPRAAGSQEGVA